MPVNPEGTIRFGDLCRVYNYRNISSYGDIFTRLILHELQERGGGAVLDIGCGGGIGRNNQFQQAIKAASSTFWGLEPDRSIVPEPGLFDEFQYATMESSDLPDASIDIAYSSMVMEHVEKPIEFLSTLARALKPGGVYLFVTPNARSFVPGMTKLMHRIGADELTLRLVRRKQQIDEYHYPVQFRCNTPGEISRIAEQTGYNEPQFAFVEGAGAESYFRGPMVPLRYLLRLKRKYVRTPSRLATLICRLERK